MNRWNKTLQKFPKDTDLGKIEVEVQGKKESADVNSLFWEIMNDTKEVPLPVSFLKILSEASEAQTIISMN